MRGFLPSLALLVLGLGFAGSSAQAQPGIPGGYRPPFSPYLNLLRPGTPPVLNYYGLVRPQIEFRNDIQGLNQQIGTIDNQLFGQQGGATTGVPDTGHSVVFMNYSHYYGRSIGSGAGGGLGSGGMSRPNTQPRR